MKTFLLALLATLSLFLAGCASQDSTAFRDLDSRLDQSGHLVKTIVFKGYSCSEYTGRYGTYVVVVPDHQIKFGATIVMKCVVFKGCYRTQCQSLYGPCVGISSFPPQWMSEEQDLVGVISTMTM